MFTGIIEETGILLSVRGGPSGSRSVIRADRILEGIGRGDNTAVNGVCLTAVSFDSDPFLVDMMPETLKHSSLGCPSIKSSPNLERAMIAGGRFDGHIVSGYIDGAGTIINAVRDGNALWHTIRSVPSILRRIIEKGSIATDSVSLTVVQVRERGLSVSLIPHTVSHAILGALKPGRVVNLENDRAGKYIERFMKISLFAHNIEGEGTKNKGTGSQIMPELFKQRGFRVATEQDR